MPPQPKDVLFSNVELLAGEYTPLLPQGATVQVDPKRKIPSASVNFPHFIPNDQVKEALDKMQPLAERAYEYRGVQTQVGRMTPDQVTIAAEPFSSGHPAMKLSKQWEALDRLGPELKGHFDYARFTPATLILHNNEAFSTAECTKKMNDTGSAVNPEKIGLGQHTVSQHYFNCGAHRAIINGKASDLDLKIDALANVLHTVTTIPDGSTLMVNKDGSLSIGTPGPPPAQLEADADRQWELGSIKVFQSKPTKDSD